MPSIQFKCAQPIHSMADPQGSGRAVITVDLDDAEALYVLSRLKAMYPDVTPSAMPVEQIQAFQNSQAETITGRTEPQVIETPQEIRRPSRR